MLAWNDIDAEKRSNAVTFSFSSPADMPLYDYDYVYDLDQVQEKCADNSLGVVSVAQKTGVPIGGDSIWGTFSWTRGAPTPSEYCAGFSDVRLGGLTWV